MFPFFQESAINSVVQAKPPKKITVKKWANYRK